jgi:galactokinase
MAEGLKNDDMPEVGRLLYLGHAGLSELYEISCPESDFLVAYTRNNPGVLGARQMGGGFGGCTINLVHEEAVETFTADITRAYLERFNIRLTAFEAEPSQGTYIRPPQ